MSDSPPSSVPPPGAKPIWGSYTGNGAAAAVGASTPTPASAPGARFGGAFGDEPLEPLSRRLLQLAGGLSLLLMLVVANSFLHSEENPLNPMAAAAERTQSEPGGRFAMKILYASPSLPQPMTAHGSGAYNAETGLSKMLLEMEVPNEGRVAFEMIGGGADLYMRADGLGEELPGGKEWLKVQPFDGHSQEEMTMGSGGGDESLQILGTVSDGVRQVGREKVRGVPTRRYRAAVEMSEIAELYRAEGKDDLADKVEEAAELLSSPVTVEASIDAKDIVRRFRMVMPIPTEPGKPALTMDMRMDLFDLGARPEIELPDPSKVLDVGEYEEQLESVETD
ncbi:MAG TPA: hypothetical protein VGV69_00460 [Solirubrobacterales bacterium]|nr:hypothetical protein [Solirubrobacterales bacterium]